MRIAGTLERLLRALAEKDYFKIDNELILAARIEEPIGWKWKLLESRSYGRGGIGYQSSWRPLLVPSRVSAGPGITLKKILPGCQIFISNFLIMKIGGKSPKLEIDKSWAF